MSVVPVGKLGCKPPRPEQQSRLLMAGKYLNALQLPAPPPAKFWQQAVSSWPMLANDTVGDCTVACVGHLEQSWAANSGQPSTLMTDPVALASYSAITGYDPSQTQANGYNPTDNGAVIVDVLNYWRGTGINGNQIGAYVSAAIDNHPEVVASIWLFGGLMCGVQLPLAWQGANIWTAPSRHHRFGQWAVGSWGGHCVPVIGYDAQFVYAISWGAVVSIQWAAWDMYFTEAYPILDSLWFTGGKIAPSGFDLPTLTADLQAVTAA